jgi:hypothetical protein
VVVVCRIGLDGTPDATFKTWGYGGSSPQGVGCSIADHASAPTWGAEVSDIDVQPGTGWVVTALTYRQGSAAAAPTNGAFTLMDDTGKDVFAGTVFDAPVFHDVTSDGDYEAARKVHFSRSSGAGAYDFFLAWDYQPAGAPRRALLRRYDALTPMEEIVVPALSDANHASVGGLAFETGPGSLGFDAAALVLLNESDGDDGSGALFRPSLERIPIDPASGALMAQGALFQSLDGFCASLAALQVRESCLVTSAVYDRASRQLWMAGSWRSQGSAIYSDVLLGRLQRTDQGGVPYLPRPLSFGDAFKRYAFNGSVGESRRHWGAALMLDDTRPVIAGDRQLDANDPGNIDHDVLLLRVRGADRLFDDGFERAY